MLIVIDTYIHEKNLCQPLETNKKPFKIDITFLTGSNGILIVTNKNIQFFFAKLVTDKDGFIQITIPPSASELVHLNDQIKRNFIEKIFLPNQIIRLL